MLKKKSLLEQLASIPPKAPKAPAGLPERYHNKLYWVPGEARTHPWSKEPGRSELVIVYRDGRVDGYDKIKLTNWYLDPVHTWSIHYIYESLGGEIPFREIWRARHLLDVEEDQDPFLTRALNTLDGDQKPKRKRIPSKRKKCLRCGNDYHGKYCFDCSSV